MRRFRGGVSSRTPWTLSLPCVWTEALRPSVLLGVSWTHQAPDGSLCPSPSAQDTGLAAQGTFLFWLPEGKSSASPWGHLQACSGVPSPASARLEWASLRRSVARASGQGRDGRALSVGPQTLGRQRWLEVAEQEDL